MEEKKQIKISLGTAICIFIIVLLLVALVVGYFYYNNSKKIINTEAKENIQTDKELNGKEEMTNIIKNEIKNEEQEDKKVLSIDTATKKITDPGIDKYYIDNPVDFGLHFSIRNGRVFFISEIDNKKWIEWDIVYDINEIKVIPNLEKEITGFSKKVVDFKLACNGQMINDVYVVFLMEDGTLEYTDISTIILYLTTLGPVKNISNIQKIEHCSVGFTDGGGKTSVIALDNNNNLYDIGYMLFSGEIEVITPGTYNTIYAFDRNTGEKVEVGTILGSGYSTYGSNLILNEDGTFEDYLEPITSGEKSNNGKYEIIDGTLTLKYSDGTEVETWTSEDGALVIPFKEKYELVVAK